MGSGASRAVPKGGASAAAGRKFPSRAPGSAIPPRNSQPQPQRPPHVSPSTPSAAGAAGAGGRPGPRPRGAAQASSARDEAARADADAIDPDLSSGSNAMPSAAFSSRLRQMGIVQPNPTYSPSSTAQQQQHGSPSGSADAAAQYYSSPAVPARGGRNATLSALDARRRLQELADAEFAGGGAEREFLSVGTVRDVLVLRAKRVGAADIERRLGLKKGIVERLGPRGRVEAL